MAIISINGDTTPAQIIAVGQGLAIVDAGPIHTISIGNAAVTIAMLAATGIPDDTTFLRGDNVWEVPPGGGTIDSINGDSTPAQLITGVSGIDVTNPLAGTTQIDIDAVTIAAIAANTAKVTNATHTGDVTGATALSIAIDAVDIRMLSASGSANTTTFLRGDNVWEVPPGTGPMSEFFGPWTANHFAGGFDLRDIGGLYFTEPNLIPPLTILPFIWYDDSAAIKKIEVNLPSSDDIVEFTFGTFSVQLGVSKMVWTQNPGGDLRNVTKISDIIGNELLKFSSFGFSKVNEFTITSANTGDNPILEATGDDDDIGIDLLPKGTGTINMLGNVDLQTNKIINSADPTSPQDLVTLAYGDANYLGGGSTNIQLAEYTSTDTSTNINTASITNIPLCGTQIFLDSDFSNPDSVTLRTLYAGRVRVTASVYQLTIGQRVSITLRVRKNGTAEGPIGGAISYIRNSVGIDNGASFVEWVTTCEINDDFTIGGTREGTVTDSTTMPSGLSMFKLERMS